MTKRLTDDEKVERVIQAIDPPDYNYNFTWRDRRAEVLLLRAVFPRKNDPLVRKIKDWFWDIRHILGIAK